MFINSAVLVGLKRPFAGFLGDALLRPLLVVGAFALSTMAVTAEAGFTQMVWLMGFGFATIAGFQFLFVLSALRRVPVQVPPRAHEARRWWRFALPWVLIALASDYFFDLDLLFLSTLLSREELAIFGVCTRVFALVSFGVATVYAVTLPEIFESEAMKDRAGFNHKIGEANLVAAGLSGLLFVGMAVFGPLLLMLFGPSFSAGALPLTILSFALVVRSVLGPAALVLSIHDRPYASLPAVGVGIGTLFAANLVLVPSLGLTGAALSALIAITLWSLALWFTALKLAGVDVSIRARLWRPAAHARESIKIEPGF